MGIKVKTLIFDLDGVIADSSIDIVSAVRYTMKHFGLSELSKEDIIASLGKGPKELIYSAFGNSEISLKEEALTFYKNYYNDNCVIDTLAYKNVKNLLEHFKYKEIAMVTNKPIKPTDMILKKLELFDYFKIVIGSDSGQKLKPNPDGINEVLKKLDTAPENAIMVGDSIYDIKAGKSANVYTCAVTYGFGDEEGLKNMKPDFLIDDINELVNIVE